VGPAIAIFYGCLTVAVVVAVAVDFSFKQPDFSGPGSAFDDSSGGCHAELVYDQEEAGQCWSRLAGGE